MKAPVGSIACVLGLLLVVQAGTVYSPSPPPTLSWSSTLPVGSTTGQNRLVAADEGVNGRIMVAWQNVQPGLDESDIYYNFFDGTSWLGSNRLTTDPNDDKVPGVAQLGNETWIVVWSRNDTDGISRIYYKTNHGFWSGETRLTNSQRTDETPSILVASDGAIWVFWSRGNCEGPRCGVTNFDLWYNVYREGIGWAGEAQLTTSSSHDLMSSASQTSDGRVWVVWSKQNCCDSDIAYKIYGPSGWGSEQTLDRSGADDHGPSMIQDWNGTIWVFWTRWFPLPPPEDEQADIIYVTSTDNGVSWSSEGFFTSTDTLNEEHPAALWGTDGRIHVFWSAAKFPNPPNIYYSHSKIHDTTVTLVQPDVTVILSGGLVDIQVQVENIGDWDETVTVEVRVRNSTSTLIATQSSLILIGATVVFTVAWDTSLTPPGKFWIDANALPLPGEAPGNSDDNMLSFGRVHVLPLGDVDRDGDVDIWDAARLGRAWDTRPGDPYWDANADFNGNGMIDIFDAATVGQWYGTQT